MADIIGGALGRNLWVVAGSGLVVGIGALLASGAAAKGSHLGDLASLALMISGIALCMISQRGIPAAGETGNDA